MVDSLLVIHQQREDTARIALCYAGLLCSWIALTISAWVSEEVLAIKKDCGSHDKKTPARIGA